MSVFYLASLESIKLDEVRKCSLKKIIHFNTGKNAVIAEVDIPIVYTNGCKEMSSNKIIVTARHENYDVIDISYCPTFVYVTILREGNYDDVIEIKADDLITIGIGELYRTFDDAKNHKFD
ncbi:MAG: hypothetical protein HUK25_09405 [Treponema sp.]|nr:hypothetical protein [Treponema sp.]